MFSLRTASNPFPERARRAAETLGFTAEQFTSFGVDYVTYKDRVRRLVVLRFGDEYYVEYTHSFTADEVRKLCAVFPDAHDCQLDVNTSFAQIPTDPLPIAIKGLRLFNFPYEDEKPHPGVIAVLRQIDYLMIARAEPCTPNPLELVRWLKPGAQVLIHNKHQLVELDESVHPVWQSRPDVRFFLHAKRVPSVADLAALPEQEQRAYL